MKNETASKIVVGLYVIEFLVAGILFLFVLSGAYSNPWQGEAPNEVMKIFVYLFFWPLSVSPESVFYTENRLAACFIWLLVLPLPFAALISKFSNWMNSSSPIGGKGSNQSR